MRDIEPELLRRYHQGNCDQDEITLVKLWLQSGEVIIDPTIYAHIDMEKLGNKIWQTIKPEKKPSGYFSNSVQFTDGL